MPIEPKVKTNPLRWLQKTINAFPDTKTAIQMSEDAVRLIINRSKEYDEKKIEKIQTNDSAKEVINKLVNGEVKPDALTMRNTDEIEIGE